MFQICQYLLYLLPWKWGVWLKKVQHMFYSSRPMMDFGKKTLDYLHKLKTNPVYLLCQVAMYSLQEFVFCLYGFYCNIQMGILFYLFHRLVMVALSVLMIEIRHHTHAECHESHHICCLRRLFLSLLFQVFPCKILY